MSKNTYVGHTSTITVALSTMIIYYVHIKLQAYLKGLLHLHNSERNEIALDCFVTLEYNGKR